MPPEALRVDNPFVASPEAVGLRLFLFFAFDFGARPLDFLGLFRLWRAKLPAKVKREEYADCAVFRLRSQISQRKKPRSVGKVPIAAHFCRPVKAHEYNNSRFLRFAN